MALGVGLSLRGGLESRISFSASLSIFHIVWVLPCDKKKSYKHYCFFKITWRLSSQGNSGTSGFSSVSIGMKSPRVGWKKGN